MDINGVLDRLRWLGQSGFLIQDRRTIYIDPWRLPSGLPRADLILVTHAHQDHFSPADIAAVAGPETVLAGPRECVTHFKGNQLPLALGERRGVLGVGLRVVQAYNIGKPFHDREKAGFGYVLELAGASLYHAGDTDLTPELAEVRADVALLPVGGVDVMGPEEALAAVRAIKPKAAVPMHFGSVHGGAAEARLFEEGCRREGVESRVYPAPADAGS